MIELIWESSRLIDKKDLLAIYFFGVMDELTLWNKILNVLIAYLLSGYREQLTVEEELADTDPLTEAFNRRVCFEKIAHESVVRSTLGGACFRLILPVEEEEKGRK